MMRKCEKGEFEGGLWNSRDYPRLFQVGEKYSILPRGLQVLFKSHLQVKAFQAVSQHDEGQCQSMICMMFRSTLFDDHIISSYPMFGC